MYTLATPTTAPRVDVLCHASQLMSPNCKLPPKFHNNSLMSEHTDNLKLFDHSATAIENSEKWGGIIRTALGKFRELAMSDAKYQVMKKQVNRAHPMEGIVTLCILPATVNAYKMNKQIFMHATLYTCNFVNTCNL